jgi:RHS repeat-associated protein
MRGTVRLAHSQNPSPPSNSDFSDRLFDGTRYFVYDDENQLLSVTVSNAWQSQYVYDGLNRRRIAKDLSWSGSSFVETNEVRYVYDGNLVVQERDTNNLPLVTYTRGSDFSASFQDAGGIGGLLARTDSRRLLTGDVEASDYYQSDDNGNVMAMFDLYGQLVAEYAYDPYGNILSISGPMASANKYRFSSKEWNENAGLYYYGYRFYEPSLQRWLNRDPIEEQGGINLYDFAQNNPIGIVDLLGLDCYRQNRQLAPKLLNHSPWPRSRYNPLSHTFIFTTNPDGTLNNTYSWGTDANPRGWVETFGPDRAAANQALGMGGNYLNKIGDSSLDNPMDKAFNDLKQNEPEHGDGLIDNNCKSEATGLEDKAKQIQQQNQDQNSGSCTAN